MHRFSRNAGRRPARRILLSTTFALVAVLACTALPSAAWAASMGTLPAAFWADPDSGYWIELIVVAIITAVAGIVFNVRKKPDP